MKRLRAILKDLQDSGQQAAIIGHFNIQLGQIQEVVNIDNVCEQPKIGLLEAGAGKNPNRYTTEHGRDDADGSYPVSSMMLFPDLVEIIAAWSNLPDSVQAGILAMVKAVSR